MSTLAEIKQAVRQLPDSEVAALRVLLAERDPHDAAAFPSIVSTPGVCGGSPQLVRTRITVRSVERFRQLGATEAQILESYPALGPSDLAQAWAYAAAHRDEIEQEIRENEEA